MSKQLTVKKYLKFHLEEQVIGARREIRKIKNDIKTLEQLRKETDAKSEKELRAYLEAEPDLLKDFDSLAEKIQEEQDKVDAPLKEAIKTGKIREVYYDSRGQIIGSSSDSGNPESSSESE